MRLITRLEMSVCVCVCVCVWPSGSGDVNTFSTSLSYTKKEIVRKIVIYRNIQQRKRVRRNGSIFLIMAEKHVIEEYY